MGPSGQKMGHSILTSPQTLTISVGISVSGVSSHMSRPSLSCRGSPSYVRPVPPTKSFSSTLPFPNNLHLFPVSQQKHLLIPLRSLFPLPMQPLFLLLARPGPGLQTMNPLPLLTPHRSSTFLLLKDQVQQASACLTPPGGGRTRRAHPILPL